MKLIRYSIIGLFIISVVFVAGNSFAQLIPYGSATTQRFDPFRAGMSPSDLEWLKTWKIGTDPSVTPLMPSDSATTQRFDPFAAGLSPSDKELFAAIYPLGPKLSVTLYGQPSAPEEPCEATTMIASELKTPQGGYLAEINDLVIDPENGRITDVVLTRFRGMGAKVVVAPFSTVSKDGQTTFLYSAPQEAYQFHGEASSESLTARKLIGSTVKTSKGEDLGRIEDLIIDHMGGCAVSLVVSGKEGRLVKVPFNSLSESGKKVFVLKTT